MYRLLLRLLRVVYYVLFGLVALYLFFMICSSLFGLAVMIGSSVSVGAILGYFGAVVALFYVYLVYHTIYK